MSRDIDQLMAQDQRINPMLNSALIMMLTEKPIAFPSEGATLRGLLISASSPSSHKPLIVMAHGTSATFRMVAIEYARAFARLGITALIYDHRSFGISDGLPRGQINPWIQCRGYRDAISFGAGLGHIDPDRIALWGDSYTGGQVVVISACDPRPKVIVAQCPVFGSSVPKTPTSHDVLEQIRLIMRDADVSTHIESSVGPLPVVSPSQLAFKSLLEPVQAFRWFIDYGGRPGTGWINEVTRVIPVTAVPYSPYLCAPFVQAKTLFMVAPADEMVHANYKVTQKAFSLIPEEKSWYDIADGHFGLLYNPSERFDEAVTVQTDFLRKHLL